MNKKEKEEEIEKFLFCLVDLKKKHPKLKVYFIKEDEEKNKLKSLLCIS